MDLGMGTCFSLRTWMVRSLSSASSMAEALFMTLVPRVLRWRIRARVK